MLRSASGRTRDSILTTSMPSSARISAAVLPATNAPNVSTRDVRQRALSDKADLPPLRQLVGGVAELVDEHVVVSAPRSAATRSVA